MAAANSDAEGEHPESHADGEADLDDGANGAGLSAGDVPQADLRGRWQGQAAQALAEARARCRDGVLESLAHGDCGAAHERRNRGQGRPHDPDDEAPDRHRPGDAPADADANEFGADIARQVVAEGDAGCRPKQRSGNGEDCSRPHERHRHLAPPPADRLHDRDLTALFGDHCRHRVRDEGDRGDECEDTADIEQRHEVVEDLLTGPGPRRSRHREVREDQSGVAFAEPCLYLGSDPLGLFRVFDANIEDIDAGRAGDAVHRLLRDIEDDRVVGRDLGEVERRARPGEGKRMQLSGVVLSLEHLPDFRTQPAAALVLRVGEGLAIAGCRPALQAYDIDVLAGEILDADEQGILAPIADVQAGEEGRPRVDCCDARQAAQFGFFRGREDDVLGEDADVVQAVAVDLIGHPPIRERREREEPQAGDRPGDCCAGEKRTRPAPADVLPGLSREGAHRRCLSLSMRPSRMAMQREARSASPRSWVT